MPELKRRPGHSLAGCIEGVDHSSLVARFDADWTKLTYPCGEEISKPLSWLARSEDRFQLIDAGKWKFMEFGGDWPWPSGEFNQWQAALLVDVTNPFKHGRPDYDVAPVWIKVRIFRPHPPFMVAALAGLMPSDNAFPREVSLSDYVKVADEKWEEFDQVRRVLYIVYSGGFALSWVRGNTIHARARTRIKPSVWMKRVPLCSLHGGERIMSKGNFRGRNGGRIVYDNWFNMMTTTLLDDPPGACDLTYRLSVRGLQESLGIDGETYNRYSRGRSPVPEVIQEHLHLLSAGRPPLECFWEEVHYLGIRHGTDFAENSWSRKDRWDFEFIDFEGGEQYEFSTKRFAINQNSKFREFFFLNTGIVTPAVKPSQRWNQIVEMALRGGYNGPANFRSVI